MSTDVIVSREVDLDLDPDELWAVVTDGSGWDAWLAPEVDVDVEPGATGTVVDDDGVVRDVRVEHVDRDRGVRFRWWPRGHGDGCDAVSTVDLVVVERPGGSALRVIETMASTSPIASASTGACWDLRLVLLTVCAGQLAPA